MANTARKERQRPGLHQEILDAALDVFATEGYQQLSMRRLAQKVGYSPATIYLHFKDKAELFECVCEQTFDQLSAIFSQIVAAATSPLEALRDCCRAYVNFGFQHPDQYTVAFLLDSGQRLAPAEVRSKFPKAMRAFLQLRNGVAACMEMGQLAPGDPELVSQVIWAGLHGITSLPIVKPSFPWRARQDSVNLMIDTLVRMVPPQTAHRDQPRVPAPAALHTINPARRRAPEPAPDPRLQRVLAAIAENPRLDVDSLAKLANLSPSRLQHLFKQRTGMPIREATGEHRLREAARLLATTEMRLKEITFAVGYGHLSSFVRAFRKRYVRTPESFRKEHARAEYANK